MKKVLITGGAGFIGHHLVDYILEKTDWEIVSLDRLDMSGNLNRLADLPTWNAQKNRVKIIWHDLKATLNEFTVKAIGEVDYIIHLAASSHVDRSIEDPLSFIMDNVVGTTNLLNYARTLKSLKKFINFSTDEVFGPASLGYAHKETDSHRPSNPYSASKSGQGAIGYSFFITYSLPVITTYTMNNFGERQHPEKLIPKTIRSVLNGTPMPIFSEFNSEGKLVAVGSRYWLHCKNTASAVLFLLEKGVGGEEYNVIGFDEMTNLQIAEKVAAIIGKPLITDYVDFHGTRPGHDMRYALDGTKMKNLGWKPEVTFEESLKNTVLFAVNNPNWR
ncbi:MAG TPA: GDP-mannose 4,6-dehydratase [Candidatus Paceibacterota bacterium]